MRAFTRRTVHVLAATTVAVAGTGGIVLATSGSNDWPYAGSAAAPGLAKTVVLAAVGDIACEPDDSENANTPPALKCGSASLGNFTAEFATADQAEAMHPDLAALLGDEQYEVGKLSDFENSFDKTWGALKFLERPAPGNHEYYAYTKHKDNEAAQNGTGYFSYFNGQDSSGAARTQGQAGDDTPTVQGWYSYDIGSWHVISLNIECASAAFGNDCSTTDDGLLAQETQWLAADLKTDKAKCTIAYWHQPTFSATSTSTPAAAGVGGTEGAAADAWWKLLYAAHADLVLNGHEHVYARFQPVDPAGNPDPKNGITQLTVGTGGEDLDTLARNTDGTFMNPNVVTGEDDAFGVAKLTLGDGSYSWGFQPAAPGPDAPSSWANYSDTGSGSCHSSRGNG